MVAKEGEKMKVETHVSENQTTTFIVADDAEEAEVLKAIAPENSRLFATLEPQGSYLYPYLKIIYRGALR